MTRKACHGSCHCGATKYAVFLNLPPDVSNRTPMPGATIPIRKCNCSTCHKMSFFHVYVAQPPESFFLITPTDPSTELGNYTCHGKMINWWFCKTCAVRCFASAGEGEQVEVDLGEALGGEKEGKLTKIWKMKTPEGGWVDGNFADFRFLTLNAATLEPNQEGLDLREWHEKGWIAYLDCMNGFTNQGSYEKPFEGGMY